MGTQGAVVKGEDLPALGRLHLTTTEQNSESQLDDYNQVIRESFKKFWMENIFQDFSY